MPDFPIVDLLDDSRCLAWLEQHFHPHGFKCPHCGSTNRRRFRAQSYFDAFRCRDCDGYFTMLTNTIFEKSHLRPAVLVLLLRGVAKDESTACLARELKMTRQQVLTLRQRIATNDTTEADELDRDTEVERRHGHLIDSLFDRRRLV